MWLPAFLGVAAVCLPNAATGAGDQEATLPFVVATSGDAPSTPVTLWVGSADGGERSMTLPPGAREGVATVVGAPPWRLRLLAANFWSATRIVNEPPSAPLRLEL